MNEKEFEDKDKHSMEAIRKAIKDWEEYSEFQQTRSQMSISETDTALEQEQMEAPDENMLIICVDIGQHKEGQTMGIGITAENNLNQLLAAWKMREQSTESIILDYLQTIKLALSKIKEQGWEMIKIHTSCTRVLNLIRKQVSNDISIAVHLEDIKDFSSMLGNAHLIVHRVNLIDY